MRDPQQAAAAAIAALHDPMRAKLYAFIRRQPRPVTREEAATAVGISRKLAAFHLDKLLNAGLLSADDLIASGRRGPGRAPKAYTPAPGEWQVSVPERRYALLAEVLTRAVLTSEPAESAQQAAIRVAAETGRQLGEHVRTERRLGRLGLERAMTATADVLEDCGYEPDRDPTSIVLRNCPFAQLATYAPELVCTLNQHLITGLLDGLGAAPRLHAALVAPQCGCCIRVRATPPSPD
ncbi:MAG: helix-turn-helix transcriptional regulator [Pseudonocardiaceae bacterium]